MPRPPLSTLRALAQTLRSLFRAFQIQRMDVAFFMAFVIWILAILFAFLSFAPMLSPFIYPLF